ncbi:MAG: ion transporter [bacterium]|nr:ion transporter [bacterium]
MRLQLEQRKKRAFEILDLAESGDKTSRVVDIIILSLISLNVLAMIMETVSSFSHRFYRQLHIFDSVSVFIFTLEYMTRIWCCTSQEKYKHPIRGRIRFGSRFMLLVDLLAIIPFYLPLIFVGLDFRVMRALRLMRIFRLIKVGRYARSLHTLGRVFLRKREELVIMGFVLMLCIIIASTILYYIEGPYQPAVFSSIPATMWWAVSTLTTVGYGDVYPITPLGKMFGAMIALMGIGLFALPAGILSSGFNEEIHRSRRERNHLHHPHLEPYPEPRFESRIEPQMEPQVPPPMPPAVTQVPGHAHLVDTE